MEIPVSSPEICVRPTPPLSLSMQLVERGGTNPQASPFALLRGATPPLRKVVQKPLFEVFDEKVYLIRSPPQTMRLVDSLRYHKPTPEERDELNLCSSTERLCLHTLTDLLLACGGRKGFRFTSSDINRLRHDCDDTSNKYELLNESFKTIPFEVTQHKFPAHVQRIEDMAEFFSHRPDSTHEQHNHEPTQQSHEEMIRWRAFQFQRLARAYVDSYVHLQTTVKEIRVRFRQYLTGKDKIEILPEPVVEVEFEAKVQHPFPAFLHCLIQKYHREQRKQSTAWTPSCPEPPVDSIGTFAVYLAYVLLQQETLSQDEVHSFEVLLQVLKLSYRVEYTQLRILDICYPEQPIHMDHVDTKAVFKSEQEPQPEDAAVRGGQSVTNTVLCAMLFEFLSTVRELRLVSKQKNLLPRRRPRKRVSRTGCVPA